MKVQPLLWLTVLIVLASCTGNNQSSDDTKLLDYKYFTIRVPKQWEVLDSGREDSFVGNISIDRNTVINFDLGWYSNDLSEGSEDYIIRNDSLIVLRKSPIPHAVRPIVDYRGKPDSNSIAALTINKKRWITIDGYKAKLITPTHIGKGTTGIYIDNLWNAGGDTDKFQINGQNLTLTQQQQLIAAFKTLKFYQHPSK